MTGQRRTGTQESYGLLIVVFTKDSESGARQPWSASVAEELGQMGHIV